MKSLKWILVIAIATLFSCDRISDETITGRIKEKTITESEALDYVSRTYEYAYIQGANDVLRKWIESEKNGEKVKLELSYFMDLKDKGRKAFLEGK
jgi:hypothetical protein